MREKFTTPGRPAVFKNAVALAAGFAFLFAIGPARAEPQIALTVPSGTFDIGQPMTIKWLVSDIPDGASLVLSAVPADGVARDRGGGPLSLAPMPLLNGKGIFVWAGIGVGCIPTDAPMFCSILPGTYRLRAEIFARGAVHLFPSMLDPKPKNPAVIATAESAEFTLQGPNDYIRLLGTAKSYASAALTNALIPEVVTKHGPAENIDRYAEQGPVRDAGDRTYCVKFTASDPFSGWIESCQRQKELPAVRDIYAITQDIRTGEPEPVVRSAVSLKPGIMNFTDAEKTARDAVMRKYAAKARPDLHSRITIRQNHWVYKSKARAARLHWGFEYFVSEIGGSQPVPDPFGAVVYVKIFSDGSAETMELPRRPGSNFANVDIWKGDY